LHDCLIDWAVCVSATDVDAARAVVDTTRLATSGRLVTDHIPINRIAIKANLAHLLHGLNILIDNIQAGRIGFLSQALHERVEAFGADTTELLENWLTLLG